MMLDDAMAAACASVGIVPPRRVVPGRWVRTSTTERNGKGDASVLVFDDRQGGIVWNWQTQQKQQFSLRGDGVASPALRRDPEKERRQELERIEVERICAEIVRTAKTDLHPYLARKGFPEEPCLIHDDPRAVMGRSAIGEAMAQAIPPSDGPLMIVPGRIGGRITTVQFISADGTKKNILRGVMSGAHHRIATGRETWVCEGIATALSVRAALRLLGRQATVVCAFSASNVAKVASGVKGACIAADHDKPVETLGGLGTGEFYAVRSGCRWSMPPSMGDYNDMHQSEGLRAVALRLREVCMS